MARALFTALALAQGAVAVFEGFVEFVDVVHNVDVIAPHIDDAFIPMAAQAAATAAPECAPAASRLMACNDAGFLKSDVAYASFVGCLCCDSTTALLPAYSSCASFLFSSATGAVVSTVGSAMATFYSACSREGGARLCGAQSTSAGLIISSATITAPTTTRTTSSRTRTTAVSAPAGCTSLVSMVNSCSTKLGAATTRISDRDAAECLCYDTFDSYNTKIEDYASTCAPFARTSATRDYSLISILQTFCDDNRPAATGRPSAATAGNGASGGIVFTPILGGGGGDDGLTPTPTGSQQNSVPAGASQTESTTRPSGARGWERPGLFWIALCVGSVMSFSMMG